MKILLLPQGLGRTHFGLLTILEMACEITLRSFTMFILLLLTTILSVVGQAPERIRVPGAAFGLTPNYGIASVYFSNGTSVPVARVQGSPGYQAFMRRTTDREAADTSILCSVFSSALRGPLSMFGVDINMCDHADAISSNALLRALRTAVESYLGTNICFAEIGLLDVEGYQAGIIKDSLQYIGLRQTLPTLPSGKFAVLASLGTEKLVYEEAPWVIFALDYSTYGFDLGFYNIDEDGIVDVIQREYYSHTSSVVDEEGEENARQDALRKILQDVLSKPPADQIQRLVVYGDGAKNEKLRQLLRTVLHADLIQNAHFSRSIFDGTTIMARASRENIDRIDFNVQPSFSCRWRPGLYRSDYIEL